MVPENPVNQTLPGAAWEEDSHNPVGQGGRVTRLTVHVDKLRFGDTQPRRGRRAAHSLRVSLCESSGGSQDSGGRASPSPPPGQSPTPLSTASSLFKTYSQAHPQGKGAFSGLQGLWHLGEVEEQTPPHRGQDLALACSPGAPAPVQCHWSVSADHVWTLCWPPA